MLPEVIWSMPPKGTMNLHGSLLPAFRGAAPIHWAVIRGEKVTGVTTFLLQHQIDTGQILLQREMPILHGEDTGSVHDRIMKMGISAGHLQLWISIILSVVCLPIQAPGQSWMELNVKSGNQLFIQLNKFRNRAV